MIGILFHKLRKHNLTISSAESITGGKFSSLITEVPGASKIFKGGFICYTNNFKYQILNISTEIEIVSKEMAKTLAINSRLLTDSDISISFTGNASENDNPRTPKGLTYIAISSNDICNVIEFKSTELRRQNIINDTAITGVKYLINFIEKNYE